MKIFTGRQIAELDRVTARNEGFGSVGLMERAAEALADRLRDLVPPGRRLCFFAGKGNNGGDALAVARIMSRSGYACSYFMPFGREQLSPECRENLDRLPQEVIRCAPDDIPAEALIVDGLLGSGFAGVLREPLRSLVETINSLPNRVVSIDMPSGMAAEFDSGAGPMVRADVTMTIEFPKLSMLMPAAGECCGRIEVVHIGLDKGCKEMMETPYGYVDESMVRGLLLPRAKFAHKGDCGHLLLVCGSEGMCGAAILSAGAALRSGCGLVTAHVPRGERMAVAAACPQALLSLDSGRCFTTLPAALERYTAVCAGCGLGTAPVTRDALKALLHVMREMGRPVVLDADALNIIAADRSLLGTIPEGSVLTPHLGELRRLTDGWTDEADKISRVRSLAAECRSSVVVKGAHTMVCMSDGSCWFNSTGNSGMAKGGSGDVLAGLTGGLMARGYAGREAALLGVWLHGRAGDMAAERLGRESMNSRDIVDCLPEAFMRLCGGDEL